MHEETLMIVAEFFIKCTADGCNWQVPVCPEYMRVIKTTPDGGAAAYICSLCGSLYWSSGMRVKFGPNIDLSKISINKPKTGR